MTNKTLGLGLVVVLIIAIIGVFTPQGRNVVNDVVDNVGSVVSSEFYDTVFARNGVVTGGYASYSNSSTTQTAITLTAAQIDTDISYLSFNTGTSSTVTTMASSSAPFSGLAIGEGFSIDFYYATTTAASVITFAAGTGVDLQEDESGIVLVNGLEMARLNFRKKADTNILMWVESAQVGD